MKKIFYLLLLFFFIAPFSLSAQGNKNKGKEISENERKMSQTYADGLREFYSGNYTAAEKTFRDIIDKNPKHDAAYFMLGKIKNATQNHNEAASYFKTAVSLNKNNEWYKAELAQEYDLTGNYEESAKLWAELAKLKPNIDYYLELQANALLHLQKYAEAIKVYDQLETLIGFTEELTEQKKNVWLVMGNVSKAANEYEKLTEIYPYEPHYYVAAGDVWLANRLYDKAFPWYEKAQRLAPDDPELLFALAEYYELVGKDKENMKILFRILENENVETEMLTPTVTNIFTSYVLNGPRSGVTQEQMLEILRLFTKNHPENAAGWSQLATLNIMQQDYLDAKRYLEKSLQLDETVYTVWEDYFFVLRHLKADQTILDNAAQVTELFPGNARILYTIGVAYLNTGKSNEAFATLKQAAGFSYEPALSASIYEMMGNACMELQNKQDAVKYWRLAKQKGAKSAALEEKLKQYE